ncbi:MAG: hypothetical protein IJM42_02525 [Synergistes sp.]|nr:hypothetical protein [Synergistes sp.]MCR5336563.1 hypothetical protein [Synergistes sp.]
MIFKISTGFFVWDVLKWLLLFAVTSLLFVSAVQYAVKRGGIRLSDKGASAADEAAGAFSSAAARRFAEECIKPWTGHRLCPIFGIASLLLLFVTAIFLG